MSKEKYVLMKPATRICPICKKQMILTTEITRGGAYRYQRSTKHRPIYACSWTCYRKLKHGEIMKKKKLTADDIAWLRFARFEVPQDKLVQWLKD